MSIPEVLEQFKFERVLSHDTRTKLLHVLGHVGDEAAILTFEKAQYEESEIPELPKLVQNLTDVVNNNIYGWGSANLASRLPDTRVKMIYPATEIHIRKYEAQARYMIAETPAIYEQMTYPYIQAIPTERIQWVQNILNGTSEADRVLFRDEDPENGFVILPDMKWDGSVESLYWVAIAMTNSIYSIRSLGKQHLGLLKNIRAGAYQLAKEKFGLQERQLRLFVHYPPSYYHFHVHITAVSFMDAPGVTAGQAHLLDTVIDNIELYGDYYQRATIPMVVGEKFPWYCAHQQWIEK
ncbi:hypothetical protein DFQ28_002945 [Apophysomyces sp. BC1034]|nr:hypothetical protein DFQ30_009694 [Apophysomyces sp. BC1015]KAG0183609.1 hypothetical protein DFQ29_000034 [Apophysomyces sp. BC1021]KAG0183612.1 hypothetical protein DFQ29_000037 [Apophysomyces sp. BC1021]KAG0194870.1 hypothetical protein DFQ28_002945 [Apophysomyces sp. BC1034]